MDTPTNVLEFVVWDRIPFAVLVILVSMIFGRLAARSLDARSPSPSAVSTTGRL